MTNQEYRLYSFSCNPLYRFRLTGPCHPLCGCTVTSTLENRSSFPLFNGNHRQEGKESTRDASGTRMPPPSGRNRHRFYSESHARGKVIDRTDSSAQAKSGQYLAGLAFYNGRTTTPTVRVAGEKCVRNAVSRSKDKHRLCCAPHLLYGSCDNRQHTAVRLVPKPPSGQTGTFAMQVKSLGRPFRLSVSGIPMPGMAYSYITCDPHTFILVRTGASGTSIL